MIETTDWIWFGAGLLAGAVHSSMLWRHTQQPTAWAPLFGLLRLGIVACVLVVSAIQAAILATAAGWAIGFVTCAIGVVSRAGHQASAAQSSSNDPGS